MIYDEVVNCILAQLTQHANTSKKSEAEITAREACQWTGPFKDLDAHLTHSCEFAPVRCTNQGCTLTPIRNKLAHHLTQDCPFRLTVCPHCSYVIRVKDTATHLTTCGKVPLTCTECDTPYLREDHGAHDLACPDAAVECPFECHGCTTVVLRRHADQHQIDSAVSHSKLLAQELLEVKEKLSDLTAIKDKVETIRISWVINNVSMHMDSGADRGLETDTDIYSKDFKVRSLLGTSVLSFNADITSTGIIGMYLHKDIEKSTDKSNVCISGTQITLLHPTDPALHATRTFRTLSDLDGPEWTLGWPEFIKNIKPYITPTDSITFEGQIRCYPDTKATVIKL